MNTPYAHRPRGVVPTGTGKASLGRKEKKL